MIAELARDLARRTMLAALLVHFQGLGQITGEPVQISRRGVIAA
jgi:hypothetical protein